MNIQVYRYDIKIHSRDDDRMHRNTNQDYEINAPFSFSRRAFQKGSVLVFLFRTWTPD